MARTFGRMFGSTWDDDLDFLALGADAKYTYSFLVAQLDLGHSGIIPLRVVPWARRLSKSAAEVAAALGELHRGLFVVVDEEEMLLLVRSLIRRDKIYLQPNVFKSAVEQIRRCPSRPIRRVLLAELERLDPAEMKGDTQQVCGDVVEWLRKTCENPSPDPSPDPSGKGSDKGCGISTGEPSTSEQYQDVATGDKGSGNPSANPPSHVRAGAFLLPSSLPLLPTPVPPTAGRGAPRAGAPLRAVPDEPTAQVILGEYLDRCAKRPPGAVVGQLGKIIKVLLAEDIDPDDIRRGLAAWMAKGLHPSTLPSVVNEVMNTRPTAIGAPSVAAAVQPAPIHAYRADLEAHAALAGQGAPAGAYDEFDGLTLLQRLGAR